MGLDLSGSTNHRVREVEQATEAVRAPSTPTRSPSETLVDSLGNGAIGAVLRGETLGGLEEVVLQQVNAAGRFDSPVDALASNSEANALLFGSDSPLIGLAETAQELGIQATPEAQPEVAEASPGQEVQAADAAPAAAPQRQGPTGGPAAWPLDLEGASPEVMGTVSAVQMAEVTGAEIDDGQLEDWARTILVQEGQRRLSDARDVIEGDIASRYEGEGAEQAVGELRELGDRYDDLLTGQASLYAQLIRLQARSGALDRRSDPELMQQLESEQAQVQGDIDTLEVARALLLKDSPELTRIVDGKEPSEHQSVYGVDEDSYDNRIADLDDTEALELVRGELADVVQSIDDTSERLASGDLDPFDLGGLSRETLGTLTDHVPRTAAGMQEQLEDHEFWEAAQDWGVAGIEVGLLVAAVVYTGGTGALVLEGAAATLGLASAAENMETALDLSDAANTHLDPSQALAGADAANGDVFWAGVDVVLSGVGLGLAGRTLGDLAAAGRLPGTTGPGARAADGMAPENFVIRREGFGHDLAADPAARAYAEASASASRAALQAVEAGELQSATDVLDFLAARRAAIAKEAGDPAADTFGVLREPLPEGLAYQTPLRDKYEYLQDRALGLGEEGAVGTLADGSQVPLTQLGLPMRLIHPDGQHVPRVLEHVDGLYADLMRQPDLPQEEVVRRIGEMHWWVAQSMPYARGSASASANFSRTVLAQRGIDLGPTAEGVALDLEAMVEPSMEAFAARYGSLHDGP